MFQKIAREDEIDTLVRNAGEGGGVLDSKIDVGCDVFAHRRVEIEGDLLVRRKLVDEVAVTRSEFDQRFDARRIPSDVADDRGPYPASAAQLWIGPDVGVGSVHGVLVFRT